MRHARGQYMMRIITANVNGIRSAKRKGFFEWVQTQSADAICLQEIKADALTMAALATCLPQYHCHYACAEKKGYSGVAIYTRARPDAVILRLNWPLSDQEGRYIAVEVGGVRVVSLYLPSGTQGPERQQHKYAFMDFFSQHLRAMREAGRPCVIAGDWNIAHTEKDLKNWKGNQKNSGFLPQERAWLDCVLGQWGFVDAFRAVNQDSDQYTWWSFRGQARAKNVGWRIDYQMITPHLAVKAAHIFKEKIFSDHAPLIVDYDDVRSI